MASINDTVMNTTIADMPIKVNAEFITGCICFVLLVLMIMFMLFICADAVYIKLKSYRRGPLTLTPVVPFPQDDLYVFKGSDRFRNVVPDAKIQLCLMKTEKPAILLRLLRRNHDYYSTMNKYMASTFKLDSRLPHEYEEVRNETNERHYRIKPKISVPSNARTISIKMDGFEHGEKCHDFVPIGGAAPGSHFTYQMYGDNRIQVTRYVVDGRSDVAGFCIYIERPWISQFEYRWNLLYHLAKSVKISERLEATERREIEMNQPEIRVMSEEITEFLSQDSEENNQNWAIKYCSKRRRKVMTSMDSDDVVLHQEWSDRNNQMKIEKCEKCTKEGLRGEEQPPAYSSIFIG